MDDPRLADVEQYHGRLRSELDVIARGPVLVGPKIIEHIHSLITLIDLHQPNEFDLCLSCDRLWPCASIIAITGISQDAGDGAHNGEAESGYDEPGAESGALAAAHAAAPDTGRPPPPPPAGYDDREHSRDDRSDRGAEDQRFGEPRFGDPRSSGPRFDEPRFDGQRPDDRRFAPQSVDDQSLHDRSFDDPRSEDRGFDDRRPEDRGFDDRRPEDRGFDDRRFDDHSAGGRPQEGRPHAGRDRDDRGIATHPDAGRDRGHVPQPGPGRPPMDVAAQSRQPALPGTRPAGPPPPARPGPPTPTPPPSVPGRPGGTLPAVAAYGGTMPGDVDRSPDRTRDGYADYPPAVAAGQPTPARPTGPAPRIPAPPGMPRPSGATPRLPGINDAGRRPTAEVGRNDGSSGRHYAPHPNGTAPHPNSTAAHPSAGAPNLPGTTPPSPGTPRQPGAPGFAPAPTAASRPSSAQPRATGAFPVAGEAGRERPDEYGSALPGLAPPAPAAGRPGRAADVPARPTGAQPRLAGGQRPDGPPDAFPSQPLPVDHSAPPGYPDRVSVPASRPAPPISGPVEMASARANGTWSPPQHAQQARAAGPAARGPVDGPGEPGRPDGPGAPGRAEGPRMRANPGAGPNHEGSRLPPGRVGGDGPAGLRQPLPPGADHERSVTLGGGPPHRGDAPPERRPAGWHTDGDLPGRPGQDGPGWAGPDPRERRGRGQTPAPDRAGPPTGAPPPNGRSPYAAPAGSPAGVVAGAERPGSPGRGRPLGAGGSGTPNPPGRGPDPRPGRPGRAEPPRRPGGQPDRSGTASAREAELSAAAARIDQAQVDEVTQAWLARRESVLDGIDVI
ncbi:hypothetical protein FF36_01665 [Frankia torreyi]|uniref:Uncharacterized protein n=1 Tax=Frankia torreyi TaxID=1856 RepID=A0A0D8BKP7_9ACTN|nr:MULTISPECIES: hypothetical protein [Frankia]KJE23977.1 hypothetical protein FF36_01665 [Frankia torreyi]KQM07382.1 hypothetical protein FF86_100374 [Frankia sp. CpI1-P]